MSMNWQWAGLVNWDRFAIVFCSQLLDKNIIKGIDVSFLTLIIKLHQSADDHHHFWGLSLLWCLYWFCLNMETIWTDKRSVMSNACYVPRAHVTSDSVRCFLYAIIMFIIFFHKNKNNCFGFLFAMYFYSTNKITFQSFFILKVLSPNSPKRVILLAPLRRPQPPLRFGYFRAKLFSDFFMKHGETKK